MPVPETCLYYPASGILGELYQISIGVGYTEPFKLFCASWIDAEDLSAKLNARNIPGVRFRPIHIKPFYSTGKGENLAGVELYVTDVDKAPLSLIQFYIMDQLAADYPREGRLFDKATPERKNMFDKVVGSKNIRRLFSKRYKVADIEDYWNKDNDSFRRKSAKYYLYR